MLRGANLDYVAADIDPSQFAEAVYADITCIPFGNDEFDYLICIHVLKHIKDDRKALGEIHRVLKPNGHAILAVPTYGDKTFENANFSYKEREIQYGTGGHLRLNGWTSPTNLGSPGLTLRWFLSMWCSATALIILLAHHIQRVTNIFIFCTKPE